MPIMFAIYLLQLMDKQTISLSSVFGLARETNLVGDDYSLLGSILYIAQLVCQPLSAFLLVKFRLSIYVPVLVTCWGVTLTCMAAARNFSGLLVSRFFLGGFEASIQGAFVLTAQTWYRRHEQGARLAVFTQTLALLISLEPSSCLVSDISNQIVLLSDRIAYPWWNYNICGVALFHSFPRQPCTVKIPHPRGEASCDRANPCQSTGTRSKNIQDEASL
ncbi:hypothetical protein BJ912DRAFT_238669 [Pholiota molesta]|nr:hypothetical protein BJ912DRAFT_238669 [Pholiota molesta]